MSGSTPNSSQQQAAPLMDSFQPTVRVMRLYKPGFHMVQSLPHVPHTFSANEFDVNKGSGSDFTLSPFLLLPDSFGDIYAGEKFSAYIAVVNGFAQVPFYQVTLAVRLQTATTVIDLADTRMNADIPGSNQYHSKTLNFNETFDMIVSQTLTEMGIHTLRVSVQYLLTPTSELKTLRKFYRFNVLQPLVIQSSYVEVNGKPMVQCEVTNATKSPIYIDEFSYIPTNRNSVCKPIIGLLPATRAEDELVLSDAALADDLKLLHPNESCAFAFMFTEHADLSGKPPGYPQVKWCTSMGEFSVYRGDFTSARNPTAAGVMTGAAGSPAGGADNTLRAIKYECLSAPAELYVGEEAEVVIRAYNTTARAMSMHLDCKNTAAANPGAVGGSLKGGAGGGAGAGGGIRPRLSTTSTISYANVLASGPPTVGSHRSHQEDGPNTGASSAAGAGVHGAAGGATTSNRGLCFTGVTFTPLGVVESADFADVTVSVYATSPGMHDLPTLFLIDSLTGERHPIVSACRILVHDSEEEDEEATVAGDDVVEVAGPTQVATRTSHHSPPVAPGPQPVAAVAQRFEAPAPLPSNSVAAGPRPPTPPPQDANDSAEQALPPPSPVQTTPPVDDLAAFLADTAREMQEFLGDDHATPHNGQSHAEGETGADVVDHVDDLDVV